MSSKKITLIALCLISTVCYSQHTNMNSQRNWSLNKKEILFAAGVSQFTGDLGGDDMIGTDYSLKDIDLKSTSWNALIGYRIRFNPYFSTTSILNLGMVRANDSYTNEYYRNNRNLHFRSIIAQAEQRIEYIAIAHEVYKSFPKRKGLKNFHHHSEQLYFFTGAALTYFNPKAYYNGEWVNLKPLSTEGQGLEGGVKPYKLITASIPFGAGIRFAISETWRLGCEATYYKTFSDYIDDVSGVYYDPSKIPTPAGQYLSNPSLISSNSTLTGQQRGSEQKDAFYTLNLVVYKNITYSVKNIRKFRNKGRFKF